MRLSEFHALTSEEQYVFQAAEAFVTGRLNDRAIFDWAVRLTPRQKAERLAVRSHFAIPSKVVLREPWLSAWRWLIEMWDRPQATDAQGLGNHGLAERVRSGERTNSLVSDIVNAVRPWVKVEPSDFSVAPNRQTFPCARKLRDLVSLRMTSGKLIVPAKLGLQEIDDKQFLIEVADKLDSAVCEGLYLGRRLGWRGKANFWRLGELRRVYVVDTAEYDEDGHEPDLFHTGIAPVVKLLYGVVQIIACQDDAAARDIVSRWQSRCNDVHLRLWAAAARHTTNASIAHVYEFLAGVSAERFWDQNAYPEVAELRATRFGEFSSAQKNEIIKRIMRLPPRSHWSASISDSDLEVAREFSALRELRRIEITGSELSTKARTWMTLGLKAHPELRAMERVTDGFIRGPIALYQSANPDFRYDSLVGLELLQSLDTALADNQFASPNERAQDWLRLEGRPERVVAALWGLDDHGASFTHLWDAIGWMLPAGKFLAPPGEEEAARKKILANQIVSMVETLPDNTLIDAIGGITHWLADWSEIIGPTPQFGRLVETLWPVAAIVTNRRSSESRPDPVFASAVDPYADLQIEVMNTPAGRLAGLFGTLCPAVRANEHAFDPEGPLAALRDLMSSEKGHAGFLARYVFMRHLGWHLLADPTWTNINLVERLLSDDPEALKYWHSIAHQSGMYRWVLEAIGARQSIMATDTRLPAEVRISLAQALLYATLSDFWDDRPPPVSHANIQQMLRSIDDYVRSDVAHVSERFIRKRLEASTGNGINSANLFYRAVKPFLTEVWPLERSLVTPGVAKAFASLPASCGAAFVDAVAAVEHLMVPFECWTISDFGFVDFDAATPQIIGVTDASQAKAALKLVDLGLGYADNFRVPYDLDLLLDHLESVAPECRRMPAFERLRVLTRR